MPGGGIHMRDQYRSPWLLVFWPLAIGGLDWALDTHPTGATFGWLMSLVVLLVCVHAGVIGNRVSNIATDKISAIGAIASFAGSILLFHGSVIPLDLVLITVLTAALAGVANVIGKATNRRST